MVTATGTKPRITLDGVNVLPTDNVWVEVLVQGATALRGVAATPFPLTLGGNNAGLFSKGVVTVDGIPPGVRTKVTIRAWDANYGATFSTSNIRATRSFIIELGGAPNGDGTFEDPASIVPAFKGLKLNFTCIICAGLDWSPMFNPTPSLPVDNRFVAVIGGADVIDIDQNGDADHLLVRVDYHRQSLSLKDPRMDDIVYSKAYLLKERIGGWHINPQSDENGFPAVEVPLHGTNYIATTVGEAYVPDGLSAWVLIANGRFADSAFNPIAGCPLAFGETPSIADPYPESPHYRFEYEVADASNVLLGGPVLFIMHQWARFRDRTSISTKLIGGATIFGKNVERNHDYYWELARFASTDVIPESPTAPHSWAGLSGDRSVGPLLGYVEMDLDGSVVASNTWPGGFVVLRDQTITWVKLSKGNIPRVLERGQSTVVGGAGSFKHRVRLDTNEIIYEVVRKPLDLNRDGKADFMLAQTSVASRDSNGVVLLDKRALALERIPATAESTVDLGYQEISSEGIVRTGSFLPGCTNFPVHFPTSSGDLAGEILVLDPLAGNVAMRYEPVAGRALTHGEFPSLDLNIWFTPLEGLRVTWPLEHTNAIIEFRGPAQSESWTPAVVLQPGTLDLPHGFSGSAMYRLRLP